VKQTFHVAVVREGVERIEGHCARSGPPAIGDRMDWFVDTFPPKRGERSEIRQAPHRVIGIREPDFREELGNNDRVIVLAPLPRPPAQA
jgi:hypothetical protein